MSNDNNTTDLEVQLKKLIEDHKLDGSSKDIMQDFASLSPDKQEDFVKNFDPKKYQKEGNNAENNNDNNALTIDELKEEDKEKQAEKNDTENYWADWAKNNGYEHSTTDKEGKEIAGYHRLSKNGKESELIDKGNTCLIKSEDYNIYQARIEKAELEGFKKVKIGENMSKEQAALTAAACLQKNMKFENGPKTIDLEMECLKDLPEELKDKIKEYNEKGQVEKEKQKEGPNKEEGKDKDSKEENKEKEPASRHDKIAAIYNKKLANLDRKGNLTPEEKQEYVKIQNKLSSLEATGAVSGTVVADKIAEQKKNDKTIGDITPQKGQEMSAAIRQKMLNDRQGGK